MEAELRALRAQISPHFIYNSLAAIASFVRTDPDRARELLLEFADFTRYAFRRGRATSRRWRTSCATSSATSPWSRPGSATGCRSPLLIAPEVLPVAVPFLAHPAAGRERRPPRAGGQGRRRHVTHHRHRRTAPRPRSSVEDDGVGQRPRGGPRGARRRARGSDSVGLGNVDARLRQVYGDELRPGGRDRPRRRDQGELPGAQVRARRARRPDLRPQPDSLPA